MAATTGGQEFELGRLRLDREEEANGFLRLMAENLAAKDRDWLRWKYLENPWSVQSPVFGAWDAATGDLVGIRAFLPQKLLIGGGEIHAAQPCDTAVAPGYRGRGLFGMLNQKAVAELTPDFPVFFNFPNQNSRPGNLKAGWHDVALLDESLGFGDFLRAVRVSTGSAFFATLAWPLSLRCNGLAGALRRLRNLRRPNLEMKPTEEVTDEFESLWARKETRIRVLRPAAYLHWRFFRQPDQAYQVWTARENGELVAYLALAWVERWGLQEARVVDYQYLEEEDGLALLGSALEQAWSQRGCRLAAIWAFTEPELYRRLQDLGFVNRTQRPFERVLPRWYMMARVNDASKLDLAYVASAENWSLRAADKDAP